MIIYTYRNYGELISTAGEINSQYSYDSRGNMLTKTTDGETTAFSYANSEWQDQLTSVNDTQLTYDANGNLVSDGRYEYQWSGSKTLETITDGENTYSYKYFNGIRSVKTINGVSTEINEKDGVVLSQSDGTNHLYFQYNGSTPIGFVLNDVQYLYITNQSGDVRGITDAEGNLIAQYAYDEWGKLLSIETAEEDNAEQLSIAEINPLRYRGYYYDNETGLYYLQSRYYNPEWCRFISADSFGYINTNRPLNINAYVYCVNNPILYVDPSGNAYVSDAGKAIGDFIGVLFLSLEAQERLGDDFAAIIATYFTKNPSFMHFEYNPKLSKEENERRKQQASEKLFNWFDETAKDFEEFMKSSFYKITKFLKDDFFFEYFNQSVKSKTKELFQNIKVFNIFNITFGYGNEDGFMASLSSLLDGKFKLFDMKDWSAGVIDKGSQIGAYIESSLKGVGNFFMNISLEIKFDLNNSNTPYDSGYAVSPEYAVYMIIAVIVFAISLSSSFGSLVFA